MIAGDNAGQKKGGIIFPYILDRIQGVLDQTQGILDQIKTILTTVPGFINLKGHVKEPCKRAM